MEIWSSGGDNGSREGNGNKVAASGGSGCNQRRQQRQRAAATARNQRQQPAAAASRGRLAKQGFPERACPTGLVQEGLPQEIFPHVPQDPIGSHRIPLGSLYGPIGPLDWSHMALYGPICPCMVPTCPIVPIWIQHVPLLGQYVLVWG